VEGGERFWSKLKAVRGPATKTSRKPADEAGAEHGIEEGREGAGEGRPVWNFRVLIRARKVQRAEDNINRGKSNGGKAYLSERWSVGALERAG